MLVIGNKGESLGILNRDQALAASKAAELDLVEITPNAIPPICRLMDFSTALMASIGPQSGRAGRVPPMGGGRTAIGTPDPQERKRLTKEFALSQAVEYAKSFGPSSNPHTVLEAAKKFEAYLNNRD